MADGDAMGLSTKRLAKFKFKFKLLWRRYSGRSAPSCRTAAASRLTASRATWRRRALGRELEELRRLGLRTCYAGCESGDDEVLRRVGKGETQDSSVDALEKLHEAGLKTSVMFCTGSAAKRSATSTWQAAPTSQSARPRPI